MTYSAAALNPIGGQSRRGSGIAIWSYKTEDPAGTVDGSGYFNDASGLLSVGDMIFVQTQSSSVPTEIGIHVVMSNASGVVDVSNIVELTATAINDTD